LNLETNLLIFVVMKIGLGQNPHCKDEKNSGMPEGGNFGSPSFEGLGLKQRCKLQGQVRGS